MPAYKTLYIELLMKCYFATEADKLRIFALRRRCENCVLLLGNDVV